MFYPFRINITNDKKNVVRNFFDIVCYFYKISLVFHRVNCPMQAICIEDGGKVEVGDKDGVGVEVNTDNIFLATSVSSSLFQCSISIPMDQMIIFTVMRNWL